MVWLSIIEPILENIWSASNFLKLGIYAVPTAVGDLGEAVPGFHSGCFVTFLKKCQKIGDFTKNG